MIKNLSKIKRGDIYFADLDPVIGSEQGGKRPVLVIQNNTGNRHSPTVVVAAMTSKTKKMELGTHVPIPAKLSNGLSKDSVALLESIRTISKTRLMNYMGRLTIQEMDLVDSAMRASFGL